MKEKTKTTALTKSESAITFPSPFEATKGINYIIGNPREWRADCSSGGALKIGEATEGAQSMKAEILFFVDYPKHAFFAEKYDRNPFQNWLMVFFVDHHNQLSSMLLKGRSRSNFIEMFRTLQGESKAIATQIVTVQMKSTENKLGKFKVVEFTYEPNTPERIAELTEFWTRHVFTDDEGNSQNLIYSEFATSLLAMHEEHLAKQA